MISTSEMGCLLKTLWNSLDSSFKLNFNFFCLILEGSLETLIDFHVNSLWKSMDLWLLIWVAPKIDTLKIWLPFMALLFGMDYTSISLIFGALHRSCGGVGNRN